MGVVPQFWTVEVNVVNVPSQTGFALTAIVAVGGRFVLTAMVMVFDVEGFPEMQVAFDVNLQTMLSPANGI
jgi:hypothetical protein